MSGIENVGCRGEGRITRREGVSAKGGPLVVLLHRIVEPVKSIRNPPPVSCE